MYLDKQKAKKKQWRIPETRFFIVSLFLGSLGVLSGMYYFRHKTKHFKFTFFIPLILIVQVAVFLYFFKSINLYLK